MGGFRGRKAGCGFVPGPEEADFPQEVEDPLEEAFLGRGVNDLVHEGPDVPQGRPEGLFVPLFPEGGGNQAKQQQNKAKYCDGPHGDPPFFSFYPEGRFWGQTALE